MNKLWITALVFAGCLALDHPLHAQKTPGTYQLNRTRGVKINLEIQYQENLREYLAILSALEEETTNNDSREKKTYSEIYKEMIREKIKLLEKEMARAREIANSQASRLSRKRKVLTLP